MCYPTVGYGGAHLKAAFWLGISCNGNFSFTFQAIKNLSTHPTYLRFGLSCKFFGAFCVNLGINSFFSQRISEIYGNSKFLSIDVVLKLEFEV